MSKYLIIIFSLSFAACSSNPTAEREISSVPMPRAMQPLCEPCANGASYSVHLTFDDGPSVYTRTVLKILREKGPIEATFFQLSSAYSRVAKEREQSNYADASPKEIQAIANLILSEHHNLACHTFAHIDHIDSKYSLKLAIANIKRGISLMPKAAIPYLRFPYGRGWWKNREGSAEDKRAQLLMNALEQVGWKHLGWDLTSFDWSEEFHAQEPRALLRDICTQQGGVVLMHDIQPWTAQNLGALIDSVRCSGHEIVGLRAMEELNKQHARASFARSATYDEVVCPSGDIMNPECLMNPREPK